MGWRGRDLEARQQLQQPLAPRGEVSAVEPRMLITRGGSRLLMIKIRIIHCVLQHVKRAFYCILFTEPPRI